MKSSIERETSVGVVKIPIGVVTKGEDGYSISNFFRLFHLFWAFLLSRIYYRKELSCKKVGSHKEDGTPEKGVVLTSIMMSLHMLVN